MGEYSGLRGGLSTVSERATSCWKTGRVLLEGVVFVDFISVGYMPQSSLYRYLARLLSEK